MKKIILNTILLLLISISCFANTAVKGKLTNSNKNPIPYANIVIKNTAIGVISNGDGDFSINIPDQYKNSSLVFSSIGYKTKEIVIQAFKKQAIYNIELETAIVNLSEVMIKVKATNANEIVQKAFDHYEKPPYNKEFWKTYSIMLPTLEQENLKNNLKKELLKK